jgi:hypothetical protein
MDKTRERAERFKPTLKNSNIAKTARPPKTATPLSGVCSPGGAAVELDGNVPVLIGLRPHEKVQRTVMIFCSGGTDARGQGRFAGAGRSLNENPGKSDPDRRNSAPAGVMKRFAVFAILGPCLAGMTMLLLHNHGRELGSAATIDRLPR